MSPKRQRNGTSPIKRARRGATAMEAIRQALEEVLVEQRPATVRQVFYRVMSAGVIEKTEAEYKTVCRLLAEMRREGRVPYSWIADNTRWMRKPTTWSNLGQALERTQETYRRALWDDQDAYVEIWLEKDALAGVLLEETRKWDVPLMVSRGFASLSFLHSAAELINAEGKPAFLYYFGDHDPHGLLIDRKIEEDLRRMAPRAEIHFQRVAVLPWQIEEWSLPTRPTKVTTLSKAQGFKGDSIEVDAIEPNVLRRLCHHCIVQHIDEEAYERTLRAEEEERATLERMVAGGLR